VATAHRARRAAAAAGHPWAAAYRFTDATVRLDLAGSRTVTTRGGRSASSTYTVAPVVPPDWTSGPLGQTVRVDIVAQPGDLLRHEPQLERPMGIWGRRRSRRQHSVARYLRSHSPGGSAGRIAVGEINSMVS
jgi:hypothetical protein